jgi:hypothetical protein
MSACKSREVAHPKAGKLAMQKKRSLPTMAEVDESVFDRLASAISNNLAIAVSLRTRKRQFRAFFGTTARMCSMLWSLCSHTLIPEHAMPVHLLWAFMLLKQYNTEEVNASMAGCDEKTFRLWCWLVIHVLADMELVRVRQRQESHLVNVW